MNLLSHDQLKALGDWINTSARFMVLDPVLRWVLVGAAAVILILMWILINAAEAAERPPASTNSSGHGTGNDPGYY